MNKTLPMLAAVALATGPALAQGTVTLYGLIDVNVTHFSAGARSGTGDATQMIDGGSTGLNGSRWGMRAVEDLGGGLKALAVAEAGFNADTGAAGQGGLAFGRQVFVGLSSAAAGELRLGRQFAFHDTVMSYTNPFGNGLWLNPGQPVSNAGKPLPQFIDAPRLSNIVQYMTPEWSGFTAGAQWAPGEDTADRFIGLTAQYKAGSLGVAASHEWNRDRLTGSRTNRVTTLGANYDFKSFKLLGGYQRGDKLTTNPGNVGAISNLVVTGPTSFTARDLEVYTAGVAVPVRSTLIGVNYTQTRYMSAAGARQTLGRVGVGVRHDLSKRTSLYAAVAGATGDLKNFVLQRRVTTIGIRHTF